MKKDIKAQIKQNYVYMQNIDKRYDELVGNIVIYIRVSLTEADAEEAINDIVEMLLGAQSRGEDLEAIIGEDYKRFCDEIIEAYKYEEKMYFLSNIKEIAWICLKALPFFIAIDCIFSVNKESGFSIHNLWKLNYKLSILPIIETVGAVPVVYSIINYIGKNTEDNKKKDFLIIFMINMMYIGFVAFMYFLFKNKVIFSISNYLICLILSAIIIIGHVYYLIKKSKN